MLTMPLLQQESDGRNLGLYTFKDNKWVAFPLPRS